MYSVSIFVGADSAKKKSGIFSSLKRSKSKRGGRKSGHTQSLPHLSDPKSYQLNGDSFRRTHEPGFFQIARNSTADEADGPGVVPGSSAEGLIESPATDVMPGSTVSFFFFSFWKNMQNYIYLTKVSLSSLLIFYPKHPNRVLCYFMDNAKAIKFKLRIKPYFCSFLARLERLPGVENVPSLL